MSAPRHRLAGGSWRRCARPWRRAIRWLWEEREPERPFFLFVHYFDSHSPYQAPGEYATRFPRPETTPRQRALFPGDYAEAVRQCDGEIAFADREIARLLEALRVQGLDGDTLVVITANHGEGLLDHGWMGHELQIYEESVRVPLVLRFPGRLEAGRRIAGPVELVDLLPTLLSLIGLPVEDGLPGRDLAPALRGEASLDPEHPVFLHRRRFEEETMGGLRVRDEEHAVRRGAWKLIERPAQGVRELYHLPSDPGERRDRSAEEPERVARLAALLAEWRLEKGAGGPVPEVPEEARAALEPLGYTE